jgi:hypothetical protein
VVIGNILKRSQILPLWSGFRRAEARRALARHIRFISVLARARQDGSDDPVTKKRCNGLWYFRHSLQEILSQRASLIDAFNHTHRIATILLGRIVRVVFVG